MAQGQSCQLRMRMRLSPFLENQNGTRCYGVAKNNRMPYLYWTFSAKESCNLWLFCEKWPPTQSIPWVFATLYVEANNTIQCAVRFAFSFSRERLPFSIKNEDVLPYRQLSLNTVDCDEWISLQITAHDDDSLGMVTITTNLILRWWLAMICRLINSLWRKMGLWVAAREIGLILPVLREK